MKTVNLDVLVERIADCVKRHELSAGCYARWLWQKLNKRGEPRELGRNEYGCADAANILYIIGRFPSEPAERAEWVRNLQELQDPETGMYTEATHHTIHTTAHCMAALELFDMKPLYKAKALEKYTTKEGLYELLEKEVPWEVNPWPASHRGAGILPCLTNTDMVGLEWKNWYFDWFWEHSDPEIGFFTYGNREGIELYKHMAGGFHYMFNHEAERRPYRYPEKIIDSCLTLMEDARSVKMLDHCGFLEIDVVYALTRAMRQTPHRFYEGKAALEKFAEEYIEMMMGLDPMTDESFNDLHMLFGAVCCLAELQTALPGKILTTKPLRLVLDRRPFI